MIGDIITRLGLIPLSAWLFAGSAIFLFPFYRGWRYDERPLNRNDGWALLIVLALLLVATRP